MKKISLSFLAIFGFLYAADGNLDNSFGTNGLSTIPQITYPSVGAYALGTFIQADGKIVLGGTLISLGQGYVTRTTSNGDLDTTFNSAGPTPGVLTLNITGGSDVNNVLVQPDGKIVAVGGASGNSILITRLNSNGSFDTTFNGGNPVLTPTPISGLTPDAVAVALDKTGGLTVVGFLFNNTGSAADLLLCAIMQMVHSIRILMDRDLVF